MIDLAEECCEGRLVAAQEGGYSENYAPYCTLAIIETMAEQRTELEEPIAPERPPSWPQTTTVGLDARATLDAVKQRQSEYWNLG
jgi:acetoin utilization deacetylase AcuC-like enzyme